MFADVFARRSGGQPVGRILQGFEEAVQPAIAVVQVVGAGPGAELLAIVPHGGHAAGMALGAFTKESDGLFARTEGQQVAQNLQAGKNAHGLAAIFADVIAVELVELETGSEEMHVVHQRVFHARRSQRVRRLRLPDALGEPRAIGLAAEFFEQIFAHQLNLPELVLGRNGNQDRFVKAAADQFHLPARGQFPKMVEELRMAALHPFE